MLQQGTSKASALLCPELCELVSNCLSKMSASLGTREVLTYGMGLYCIYKYWHCLALHFVNLVIPKVQEHKVTFYI